MGTLTTAGQTITMSSPQPVLAARPAGSLAVVHPAELARQLTLTRTGLVLGRKTKDPSTELAHGTVSRNHVKISWDGRSRAFVVSDLGSRNGSWLNGARLAEAPSSMRAGDVLRLGEVVAVYEPAVLTAEDDESLIDAIPGDSPPMRRLRRQIGLAAADPSPALVIGPTGAGKEHVVRALHAQSGRKGPLVAVNVTELSEQLAESQLFGHVRGAFTGASGPQPGLIRSAERGTLFLDEIGELPAQLQPKLLRVIQERVVRPVGGTREESVDVRIVAATNRDLVAEVDAGRFRRDLWGRLSLWELTVPALDDRRGDILTWIDRFHRRWCEERGRQVPAPRFEAQAVEALLLTSWPENLRGIDRLVHRLALESDDSPVSRHQLGAWLDLPDAGTRSVSQSQESETVVIKRPAPETADELREVLATHGSIRATARWYGRHRRQIYRWMDALGVDRESG